MKWWGLLIGVLFVLFMRSAWCADICGTIAEGEVCTTAQDNEVILPHCYSGACSYRGPAIETGTGTISTSGTTVTGSGTSFVDQGVIVGTALYVTDAEPMVVSAVTSNTSLTITTPSTSTISGASFTFQRPLFRVDQPSGVAGITVTGDGRMGITTANPTAYLEVKPPALASVSGNAASLNRETMTIRGQPGTASTGGNGGDAASVSITGGAGGATTGTSKIGGAGAGVTITGGAGGDGSGGTNSSANSGANVTIKGGAAGAKSGSGAEANGGDVVIDGGFGAATNGGSKIGTVNGDVTLGSSSGKVTQNGDWVTTRSTDISLANGANADVAMAGKTFARLTGGGASETLDGFTGGVDGKRILVLNATGSTCTINSESSSESTTTNRIVVPAASTILDKRSANFIYVSADSRWHYAQ